MLSVGELQLNRRVIAVTKYLNEEKILKFEN